MLASVHCIKPLPQIYEAPYEDRLQLLVRRMALYPIGSASGPRSLNDP